MVRLGKSARDAEDEFWGFVHETGFGPGYKEGEPLPDDPDGDEFPEDEVSLDDPEWVQKAMTAVPVEHLLAETKKFGPNVGPGYIDKDPDPSPDPRAGRLRRYWTRGPGAAKIKWGTDGDFKRCVRQVRKYVGTGAEGLCNVYHHAALGTAPGQGPHVGGKSAVQQRAEDLETKATASIDGSGQRTSRSQRASSARYAGQGRAAAGRARLAAGRAAAGRVRRTVATQGQRRATGRGQARAERVLRGAMNRYAGRNGGMQGSTLPAGRQRRSPSGKRIVRTAAGAARFGVPIGSEIGQHKVKKGDTLYALAERYLGDGNRWKEIAKANKIKDPRKVPVGITLNIPGSSGDAGAPAAKKPAAKPRKPGDEQHIGKDGVDVRSRLDGDGEPMEPYDPTKPFYEDMAPQRSPKGGRMTDFTSGKPIKYSDGWSYDPEHGWTAPGETPPVKKVAPGKTPGGSPKVGTLNGFTLYEDGSVFGPWGWVREGGK
jgi:LysM repeat protein